MSEVEFKGWPKIPRGNPFMVTVTEKIDGTNACVIIKDGEIVGVQSRKRFITPEDDNYGFAGWVERNKEDLVSLGDGYHHGEWAGLGIQKNPHALPEKQFFLFNTFRWIGNPDLPSCCKVVPLLYEGELDNVVLDSIMDNLELTSEEQNPEGVIVYYHSTRTYTKHTFKTPNGKWKEQAA